jgi:putative membrane-bound dehydrogenase-like protein
MLRAKFSVALLMVTMAVTGHGYQSSSPNRAWPPDLQRVSRDSTPLSPQEALKTFYMPPGYRLELVASEPLIQEPVAIDWDVSGRLWAVEMPGFMANITGSNEHDPIGRVIVLEDTDGDGRMDRRTVFADGLVLARSIKILDRGVLVAEPPNVWLMRDLDGDLRMDTKELVTGQYGRREGDPQNNANGFHWALDNQLYTAGQSDVQLRLKNGAFEVRRTLQRGEWGVTEDDAGHIYRNTNESALHVDLVPTAYFARNPNLLRTRGSYERLRAEANSADGDALNIIWPVRPNPGTNRAYQTGIDRPDGSLERFTAVCAPLVYRGDRLPPDLYGNVFVAEPAANLVSRIVVSNDGATMRARKAYERGEFLASSDERFRPVFLTNAPDGTLYIVDMYRGIIEHRLSLTVYLRDYILGRKLDQPTGFGRIYRVVHETTRRDTVLPRGVLSSNAQLVETLSHPNGWWRDTAQRLLVERGAIASSSVAPLLVKLALGAELPRTRVRALWTLDGLDTIEPSTVIGALNDPSPDVRTSAIRIAERWLGAENHPVQAAVLKRLDDGDWMVRYQLAASLGAMPPGVRDRTAVVMLERHAGDPIAVDAVLSGLRGSEAVVLEWLMQGDTRPATPDREAVVTMLAATIARSAQDAPVQALLEWIADARRANWQRAALLRGAEVAWLGAPIPGTPGGGRGAPPSASLPCPTCPGGRAGPGGAYAYSTPEDFVVASGRAAGRGSARSLQLSREPTGLLAMAVAGDALAPRVAALLDRANWPGKPGAASPIVPLTVQEQQRYDAGREIYRNICQACHQPDGRGQDKLAPSLIDSPLALAASDITARILLNGKEGAVGLMPPIGSTLTDDDLASVLTYVRREWGQTGTAVDPETIRSVRALTSSRTRPWTNDELASLAAKGR